MSRRARGEGAIYQRSDGRWEAVLQLGYAKGKRKRWKRVAPTKKAAAEALARLQHQADAGLTIDTAGMTVGEWLAVWLRDEAAPTVRPRTLITYRRTVEAHLIPALGHVGLRQLTPSHVRAYLTGKRAGGLAGATVQNHHIVLRRALEIAYRYEYVEKNVARMVGAPRPERYEAKPLTRDEVVEFLEAARGHPLEALFVVAASTGLRQAEVLGLTWPCVDLEEGFVRVDRTLARYDRAFHMDPPKTATSRRAVAVPSQVVDMLRICRLQQFEQRLKAPHWENEWDLVFTSESGAPIGPRAVHHEFVRLLDQAGVRRVRFHDLRHGAATFLLAQGVPMKVVQEVLGHAQMSMTADLYSHVVPELRRDAADRMGTVLFGTT